MLTFSKFKRSSFHCSHRCRSWLGRGSSQLVPFLQISWRTLFPIRRNGATSPNWSYKDATVDRTPPRVAGWSLMLILKLKLSVSIFQYSLWWWVIKFEVEVFELHTLMMVHSPWQPCCWIWICAEGDHLWIKVNMPPEQAEWHFLPCQHLWFNQQHRNFTLWTVTPMGKWAWAP